jgi:hypothetical protein
MASTLAALILQTSPPVGRICIKQLGGGGFALHPIPLLLHARFTMRDLEQTLLMNEGKLGSRSHALAPRQPKHLEFCLCIDAIPVRLSIWQ